MTRKTTMRGAWWIAALAAVTIPSTLAGQTWRDVTMSRQLGDVDELRVHVEYGAGTLSIGSLDEGLLYRMELTYDEEHFEPIAELSGDRLHLGVESLGGRIRGRHRESARLELDLARGVPMELELEFGAVRADVDLGGLALTDLDLRTGASQSTFDVSEPNPSRMRTASFEVGAAEFTARHLGNLNAEHIDVDAGVGAITLQLDGRWQRDARISVDMGLGALTLRIPEGLGVRLRKDSFLTSIDPQGLVKRGDVYESLDWEEADRKVTIDLDAAFGRVDVVWIR